MIPRDADDEDATALQRYRVAAEHAMVPGLAVLAATRIARYGGATHRLLTLARVTAYAVVGLAVAHDARDGLCLRCITEIAADAPAAARRQGAVLRYHHRMSTDPALRGATAAAAVLWAAARTGAVSRVAEAPLDVLVLAAVYARWLHHRRWMWCLDCSQHPTVRRRPAARAGGHAAGPGR